MSIQPHKKVVNALQSNKLTIKDARTRKKYWNKPYGYYTECPNCNWKIVDAGYWREVDGEDKNIWTYYDNEECGRCGTILALKENEENYMDLVCYTNWTHWNRNYKFLPITSTYKKICETVNKELDEYKENYRKECVKKFKDPAEEFKVIQEFQNNHGVSKEYKGSSFRLMPYFVISNANNTITIITQNTRQLDFAKLDIIFFWRGNKWLNKAKTNKDKRVAYWCSGVNYINDKNGTCVLTLEKDYMWSYYGNVVESKAHVNIFTSQLGNSHEEKEYNDTGELVKSTSYHKEDYHQGDEEYCRACNNCFDFCGDLRDKCCKELGNRGGRSAYNGLGVPQWQPTFTVGMTTARKITGTNMSGYGSIVIGDEKDNINVPNNVWLDENRYGHQQIDSWAGADKTKPILFFLLDGNHFDSKYNRSKEGLGQHAPNAFPMYFPCKPDGKRYNDFKNDYFWEDLPKEYGDQPHLLNHSSLQAYFQKKLLFTANWKHVLVRRKKDAKVSGKRGISKDGLLWVLGYRIITRSSIAGILYNWESGDIFFKWELKVKGSYQSTDFLTNMIDGLIDAILPDKGGWLNSITGISEIGGESGQGEGGSSWFNPLSGISNFLKLCKEGLKGWVKKQVGTNFNEVFTADKLEKISGIKDDNKPDLNQAESEKQTERQKKSTAKGQNRIVEPSIFYTNTIDFAYDFFEYGNRSIADPFMLRSEHSKLLHDNLVNNNNKNPIQQFNIRVKHLKQCITEGEWQAEVDMFDFDTTDGWWKRTAGGGVFFYKDLKEFFPDWQPLFRVSQSRTKGDTGNAGGGQGREEADVEITKGEKKKNVAKSEDTVCERDNLIIFIDKPSLKNSANQELIYTYLQQTPNWTGNSWTCDPNGWEKTWTLPADTYTYNWKIWTGNPNSGTHIGISEVQLTLTHPSGGGKGKGAGVVIMTLESQTEDKTKMKFNFKDERVEFEKDEEYKDGAYKEPDFAPTETELDIDVEVDNDADREDMENDLEEFGDRDAGEKDDDEDWDNDLDEENDNDDDEDFELDSDNDEDSDEDEESDEDDDDDSDTDTEGDLDSDAGDDDDDADAGG